MSIGVSIFLIAVGAILRYAVDADWSAVNEGTVGMILMIVGGIGILVSLVVIWAMNNTTRRISSFVRREDVVDEDVDDSPRRYRRS